MNDSDRGPAPMLTDAEYAIWERFEWATAAPEAYSNSPALLIAMDKLGLTPHVERIARWISRRLVR